MVSFDRSCMVSESCSIVTMTITLTVCEIGDYRSENANSNPPQHYLKPRYGVNPLNLCQSLGVSENQKDGATVTA